MASRSLHDPRLTDRGRLHLAIGRGAVSMVKKTALALNQEHEDNDWILSASSETFKLKTPHTREAMIVALSPYWQFERHSGPVRLAVFLRALHDGAFECLPHLHRLGYRLPEDPGVNRDVRLRLATALGQGHWSFPELFCPDLFTGPDGHEALQRVAQGLFTSRGPDPRPEHALGPLYLQRMLAFPGWPDASVVGEAFSKALGEAIGTFNAWDGLTRIPGWQDALKTLMTAGWLDPARVEGSIQTPMKQAEQSLKTVLAGHQQQILDQCAEPSEPRPLSARRGPSARL